MPGWPASTTSTSGPSGYRAEALHGGMSQEQRDRVMHRVRAGTAELLIATDMAARGLEVIRRDRHQHR